MIGIALMLAAAVCNASSSVLQRKASRIEDSSEQFSFHMLWDLAHRPAWGFGILTMLTGFLLHAVSISVAPISLVQPLLIAELPLTLLLASLTFHSPIDKHDWIAIGMASLGLATFVASLAPQGGAADRVSAGTWVIAITATVVVVATLVTLGHRRRGQHRAVLLGVATGAAFGLNSSLISAIGASVGHGGDILLTWQTYGVLVIGPSSFFLLQNALAAGNLVASQPGLTLQCSIIAASRPQRAHSSTSPCGTGHRRRPPATLHGASSRTQLLALSRLVLTYAPRDRERWPPESRRGLNPKNMVAQLVAFTQ